MCVYVCVHISIHESLHPVAVIVWREDYSVLPRQKKITKKELKRTPSCPVKNKEQFFNVVSERVGLDGVLRNIDNFGIAF